jgi:hypothetical protein
LTTPAFADILEVSPTKVIVDSANGVILREPSQIDYSFVIRKIELENEYNIKEKETKTADRTLFERIFKKCNRR